MNIEKFSRLFLLSILSSFAISMNTSAVVMDANAPASTNIEINSGSQTDTEEEEYVDEGDGYGIRRSMSLPVLGKEKELARSNTYNEEEEYVAEGDTYNEEEEYVDEGDGYGIRRSMSLPVLEEEKRLAELNVYNEEEPIDEEPIDFVFPSLGGEVTDDYLVRNFSVYGLDAEQIRDIASGDEDHSYYGDFVFFALASIAKQFNGDQDYQGGANSDWEEWALIQRIRAYVEEFIQARRDGLSSEALGRASAFLKQLIFRYGNRGEMVIENDMSRISSAFRVADLDRITALGVGVKASIKSCYQRARENDQLNNAIGKVGLGNRIGTGTLIEYEGMPDILKGRVVLTAGHCFGINAYRDSFEIFKGDGTGKTFCPKSGFGVRLAFNDTEFDRVYVYNKLDVGIGILKERSELKAATIAEQNIPGGMLNNIYSIGYGGFLFLDNVEFGKKKATMKFSAPIRYNNYIESVSTDNDPRICSAVGGDSGSPLIHNGNVVGVVLEGTPAQALGQREASGGRFLDRTVIDWIKARCADAETRELNSNK